MDKIPLNKTALPKLPETLSHKTWCGVQSTDWRERWARKTGRIPGPINLFNRTSSKHGNRKRVTRSGA